MVFSADGTYNGIIDSPTPIGNPRVVVAPAASRPSRLDKPQWRRVENFSAEALLDNTMFQQVTIINRFEYNFHLSTFTRIA